MREFSWEERLISELEVGIAQEAVEEKGDFAHDGDEGDFFGFARVEEAAVEELEARVVDDGGEGGHVESAACGGAGSRSSS